MMRTHLTRVEALRNGDSQAWARLLEEFRPQIEGYARRMGAIDADDVAGATFESVTRHIARFSGSEAQFRSWIFTLAHARIVDDIRRRSRRPEVELRSIDAPLSVEVLDLVGDGDDQIAVALAQLSEEQRDLLEKRFVLGLPMREIAAATGRTEEATRVAIHRCARRLRELLTADVSIGVG